MLLEKILPSKKRQDRFELYFENGETLLCTAVEVADFSLYSERELTPEEYESLKAAAALTGTKERAAALLAYRAMSAGELERKLVEKGETEENAQSAVEWLSRLGALDDLEYAKSVVRHYSGKGWGAGRIREEFYRRRIPREHWEEALEELSGEEERLERFVERRLSQRGGDPKERKKLADALYRRGYSWEQIKNALARYSDESDEDEY